MGIEIFILYFHNAHAYNVQTWKRFTKVLRGDLFRGATMLANFLWLIKPFRCGTCRCVTHRVTLWKYLADGCCCSGGCLGNGYHTCLCRPADGSRRTGWYWSWAYIWTRRRLHGLLTILNVLKLIINKLFTERHKQQQQQDKRDLKVVAFKLSQKIPPLAYSPAPKEEMAEKYLLNMMQTFCGD